LPDLAATYPLPIYPGLQGTKGTLPFTKA
jgi:hypothetical protein